MVAFAEEAGCGWDVGKVVGVDCCGGGKVFGFGEGVGKGLGELLELGWGKGNQSGGGEGFAPEVGEAVGFAGGGVVGKVFVGFGGVSWGGGEVGVE